MKGNSIPVCRSILDHWVYKDSEYFKAWFEMLARAKYTEGERTDMYNGTLYTIKRGEFIFGYPSWSERLNIGQQKLRTLIKKLIQSEMITLVKHYSKFTVYYINNYSKFNNQDNNLETVENKGIEGNSNNQSNNQTTSKQQADDNQLTTNKESKEGEEGKKIKYTGEFEEFYKMYPNPFNKEQTFKNWKTSLKKDTLENIMLATNNYVKYVTAKNTEKQYIVRSTNFLGQKQEYKGYLEMNVNEKIAVGQTSKVIMYNFDED